MILSEISKYSPFYQTSTNSTKWGAWWRASLDTHPQELQFFLHTIFMIGHLEKQGRAGYVGSLVLGSTLSLLACTSWIIKPVDDERGEVRK